MYCIYIFLILGLIVGKNGVFLYLLSNTLCLYYTSKTGGLNYYGVNFQCLFLLSIDYCNLRGEKEGPSEFRYSIA